MAPETVGVIVRVDVCKDRLALLEYRGVRVFVAYCGTADDT